MRQNNSFSETTISIHEKVDFLKQPKVYPEYVNEVETKETHMSWVFLAGNFVYKLKKPIKYKFQDLSTIELRHKNCLEEVRLNQVLAKDIYLKVLPLVLGEDGKLHLEQEGQIVDWLIKMKRIPDEHMLDYAIKSHQVKEEQIKEAAKFLADFYKSSTSVEIFPDQYKKKLEQEIIESYKELLNQDFNLPLIQIESIHKILLRFLFNHSFLFDRRISNKKIIEAHGDLRPEHIRIVPYPVIIDRLEFSRELSVLDPAEELSYLAMECEKIGSSRIGQIFFDTYLKESGDLIPEELILFYKGKRAFLRAYLVARHIAEPAYKDKSKWFNLANAYLNLAEKYCTKIGAI